MKFDLPSRVAASRAISMQHGHDSLILCVLFRCTCVENDAGGARANCIGADDDQFCRCVVNNNGDTSQVGYKLL